MDAPKLRNIFDICVSVNVVTSAGFLRKPQARSLSTLRNKNRLCSKDGNCVCAMPLNRVQTSATAHRSIIFKYSKTSRRQSSFKSNIVFELYADPLDDAMFRDSTQTVNRKSNENSSASFAEMIKISLMPLIALDMKIEHLFFTYLQLNFNDILVQLR